MPFLISTFTILIAVALGNVLARLVPRIASAYFNVALGIVIAVMPFFNHLVLSFEDDVFMVLVVAPLLFFEGQRTPIQLVGRHLKTLVGSAVFLAIIGASVAAGVVSSVFSWSLSTALALVAIATPTDATARESVTNGRKLPASTTGTLTMEALFNDATGLILLQAAIIWQSTGHLDLVPNIGRFFYAAGVGIMVGAGLAGLLMIIRQLLIRSTANVVSSQTLLFLLTPFIIYWIAEAIHVSGIIAVVTAGLVANSETVRSRFSAPVQMHLGVELVNFSTDVLNGFVFVILGINLGRILTDTTSHFWTNLTWLGLGAMVYLVLVATRLVYAWVILRSQSLREYLGFALGGVHGTVNLALTFTLVSSGFSPIIFQTILLAETVIIVLSLLVPTIVFALILPVDGDAIQSVAAIAELRQKTVSEGIRQVKKMALSPAVAEIVIYDLKDQMGQTTISHFGHQWRDVTLHPAVMSGIQSVEQRRALMYAFTAERDFLYRMAKDQVYRSEDVYVVTNEVLLAESLVLDPSSQFL